MIFLISLYFATSYLSLCSSSYAAAIIYSTYAFFSARYYYISLFFNIVRFSLMVLTNASLSFLASYKLIY